MPRRNWRFWQVPVTDELDEALRRALVKNTHVSMSEYIRDAVRTQLRKEGYLLTPQNRSHAKRLRGKVHA